MGKGEGKLPVWRKRLKWLWLPALCLSGACLFSFFQILAQENRKTFRAERDVTFRDVTMEEMKDLEEREKGGMTGLEAVAAWRTFGAGNVTEPETGKKEKAGVLYIYGPMSLAFPSRVLSGSFDQAMGKRDCVLTRELSWSLFGSVDTEGCSVIFGDETYRVAAVIDRKEKVLFLPTDEGAVQKAAFGFAGRERIAEKLEALGFPKDGS